MEITPDELAGIVDLFGGLSEAELLTALEDLAARTGESYDPEQWTRAVDEALDDYYLVRVPCDQRAIIVPGPVSLPALPEHGDDLPHILDVDRRRPDPSVIGRSVEKRLRGDAARAINEQDRHLAERLLDICYEVDTWGSVDTTEIRTALNDSIDPP